MGERPEVGLDPRGPSQEDEYEFERLHNLMQRMGYICEYPRPGNDREPPFRVDKLLRNRAARKREQ